jgi:hypothetical protein
LEVCTLNSQRKLNFDSHHTSSYETTSTYPLTKHELYFNITMKLHTSLPIDAAASCTSIVLGLGSFPLPACPHNLVYDSSKSNNRRYPWLILLSFPIRSDFCTDAPLLLQFSTKEKVHIAFFPVFAMCVCILCKGKHKEIPEQAYYVPIGFRELEASRFQDMKVVSLLALCTSCPSPTGNIPCTHFC